MKTTITPPIPTACAPMWALTIEDPGTPTYTVFSPVQSDINFLQALLHKLANPPAPTNPRTTTVPPLHAPSSLSMFITRLTHCLQGHPISGITNAEELLHYIADNFKPPTPTPVARSGNPVKSIFTADITSNSTFASLSIYDPNLSPNVRIRATPSGCSIYINTSGDSDPILKVTFNRDPLHPDSPFLTPHSIVLNPESIEERFFHFDTGGNICQGKPPA